MRPNPTLDSAQEPILQPQTVPILGVPLALTDYDSVLEWIDEMVARRERGYVCVANVHTVMAFSEDPGLRAAVVDAVRELGIQLRVGLHAGECELVGRDVAGMTVHVASRVLDQASADEVLVTQEVTDLIGRSELAFTSRGWVASEPSMSQLAM